MGMVDAFWTSQHIYRQENKKQEKCSRFSGHKQRNKVHLVYLECKLPGFP